jgi:undecaprenyl-diphosphatase
LDYLIAVILAVVEGLTEFLPISSTGHMILVEDLLQMQQDEQFRNAFIVIIQLPAILSVVVYFWKDLWPWGHALGFQGAIRLWTKIVAGFLPAAVLGLLLDDLIDAYLFNTPVVATALVVGGIILLALEWRRRKVSVENIYDIGYGRAVLIGFFQALAMIPGTSRSAATIIGAMLLGCSRTAAAKFSFYLAIPTMLGATTLKIMKGGLSYTGEQWTILAIGSVVSFIVAYLSIKVFMGIIQRYSLAPFGWYRIALGGAIWIYFLVAAS